MYLITKYLISYTFKLKKIFLCNILRFDALHFLLFQDGVGGYFVCWRIVNQHAFCLLVQRPFILVAQLVANLPWSPHQGCYFGWGSWSVSGLPSGTPMINNLTFNLFFKSASSQTFWSLSIKLVWLFSISYDVNHSHFRIVECFVFSPWIRQYRPVVI